MIYLLQETTQKITKHLKHLFSKERLSVKAVCICPLAQWYGDPATIPTPSNTEEKETCNWMAIAAPLDKPNFLVQFLSDI